MILHRTVMESDPNLAVGKHLDELPFLLDALQRVEDAPPQLFVRADELHPETIEFLLEPVA